MAYKIRTHLTIEYANIHGDKLVMFRLVLVLKTEFDYFLLEAFENCNFLVK